MLSVVRCPHCHKEVEISSLLIGQIRDQVARDVATAHRKETVLAVQRAEENIRTSLSARVRLELTDKENETRELRQQNESLQKKILETNKLIRDTQRRDREREIALEERLRTETDKLRQDIIRQFSEEHRLKDLEKEKKISDMEKLILELQRKSQQGSMQTQGEVLELDLENTLSRVFPDDEIRGVEKGVTGADVRHIVRSSRGSLCGVILWESKRTKAWSDGWIVKLKDDLRREKANIPAIVSTALPEEARAGIGQKDGVWICSPQLLIPLALLLRKCIFDVAKQTFLLSHTTGKAELLYAYLTSHEFSQQIEALVEVYQDMREQIAKERIVYEKNWSRREAQILRMIQSTVSIYGSMQGIAGPSLPQLKGLDTQEDVAE